MAETVSITIPSPSVFLRASPAPQSPPKPKPKYERKRSTAATKKRPGAASKTSSENGAVAKPKQSKSRNGCVTCKSKRLKCDEEKPACQQCLKRNVECGGYKKDFKWRPFEESNVKANIEKQKQAQPVFPKPREPKRPAVTVIIATNSVSPQGDDEEQRDYSTPTQPSLTVSPDEIAIDPALTASASPDSVVNRPLKELGRSPDDGRSQEQDQRNGTAALPPMASPTLLSFLPNTNNTSCGNGDQMTPGTFDMLDCDNLDFMQEMLSASEALPNLDGPSDEVEEVVRHPFDTQSDSPSYELILSPMRTSMAGARFPQSPATLYDQPSFALESPEVLAARFDRFTCGILSVKDGPNENPWRTLLWPMARSSPALFHAISSMSAFHSSHDMPLMRVAGHEHKDASVRNLIEGINEGTMTLNNAIATTLALAFAEAWDQHTSSGNDHIKGARSMINIALSLHRQTPQTGVGLAQLKFLCNAWVYLDVIARLTSTDDDESDDYDKIFELYSLQDGDENGFGIDFGMPIDAQLDPLMGCANTLFPLIGRVANLVRRVRRSESNSAPIISQGIDLKLQVEAWDPPAFIEAPEDPTANVQHSVQTAEAYRWATLLYLHQAVPEIPYDLPSSEMAKKVLVYLATVPLVSRFVIVHIYPLMAAGCEAVAEDERQWVRDRWNAMGVRMRIGPIEKCAEVTEEVWRRKDMHDARPTNKRALVSTAGMRGTGPIAPMHTPAPLKRGQSFMDSESVVLDDDRNWTEKYLAQSRVQNRPIVSGASERPRRGSRDAFTGAVDPAHTVHGELHWLGVMKDWGWEILLG